MSDEADAWIGPAIAFFFAVAVIALALSASILP